MDTISLENYLALSTKADHIYALWLTWVYIQQKWVLMSTQRLVATLFLVDPK